MVHMKKKVVDSKEKQKVVETKEKEIFKPAPNPAPVVSLTPDKVMIPVKNRKSTRIGIQIYPLPALMVWFDAHETKMFVESDIMISEGANKALKERKIKF